MKASAAFRSAFTQKSLSSLYFSFVRYRGTIGLDGIKAECFEKEIDSHIRTIQARAREGTYSFTPYRARLVSKGPRKAPRILSIPTVRDKLLLRALMTVLGLVFSAHVHRRSLHGVIAKLFHEIRAHTVAPRYDWFLRFDVINYYPSIKHELLYCELFRRIRKPEIRALLRKAVANPTKHDGDVVLPAIEDTGIPQGLSISNILADVYLDPLDREFGSRKDISFLRYADDLLILCTSAAAESVVRDLRTALDRLSLRIPEFGDAFGKSAQGSLAEGFEFLGYTFSPSSISVRAESRKPLRDSLVAVLTSYKYSKKRRLQLVEWTVNLKITGCVFNHTRYGWIHYYSQMTDEGLLHSLDHFVQKQLRRFGIHRGKIRVKSFVRAWHEINFNSRRTSYIPDFDSYGPDDKRTCVRVVRDIDVSQFSDAEIDHEFRKIVYRSIQQLEKDLEQTS